MDKYSNEDDKTLWEGRQWLKYYSKNDGERYLSHEPSFKIALSWHFSPQKEKLQRTLLSRLC
jgi:hypothetical protein